MGNHDDFDLDVRLGSGRSLMGVSQLQGGGEVTNTCQTCETCPAICTGQTCGDQDTCAGQNTCDCPSQQPAQNTCSTCVTQCNPHTCGDDTCSGHTCDDICPPVVVNG